jgi:hypothetical protein
MRSPAAERSLRRLVARLATAEPDDVAQVLDALAPAQRSEVRALLDAYAAPTAAAFEAPPAPPDPPPPPRDTSHLAGLSPWLAARAQAAEDAGADGPGRMTPAARQALAEVVKSLPQETGAASGAAAPSRRPGFGLFRRRGASSWA